MTKGATYTLNLITLAAWLSAALGALVGFSFHQDWTVAFAVKPKPLSVMTSIDIASSESEATENEAVTTEATVETITATLPAPPALPDLAPIAELPEIPEMPASIIRETARKVAAPTPTPRPQSNPSKPANSSNTSAAAPSAATSLTLGTGAGRQPSPSYPVQARRNNQQGTVVVEFLVGVDGKVLNAWLKSASAYDLLNNSALSTIRNRWKFPEGPARRYKISIVFQLN